MDASRVRLPFMSCRRSVLSALTLVALALPGAADLSLFETLPEGRGNVRIVDETGVTAERRPPQLQGITLLDVEFVGRTVLQGQLGRDGHRFELPGGAAYLALPLEGGTLYRFRRAEDSGQIFGWFHIDAAGTAHPLLERPGLGARGRIDPFSSRVGLAADGRTVLVATTPAAGGDALEIDLASRQVRNRTAKRPPLEITLNGLALLPDFGVVLTPRGPWRFDRQAGAEVVRVPVAREGVFGVPGSAVRTRVFASDLVCSADGSTVAVCAGPAPDALHLWVFGAQGQARRVTETPARISGGGFLPESLIGPTMALSSDGSHVAWRVQHDGFADIRVRPTRTERLALPALEVTADALFADTLDETGVMSFASPDDLVMVVGEGDPTGTIDSADVYLVENVGSEAPTLINVTATSFDLQAPFLESGRFSSEDGLMVLPDRSGALAFVRVESGSSHIDLLDWRTRTSTRLIEGVDELLLMLETEGHVILGVLRRQGDNRNHELFHLAPGATRATRLMSAPNTPFGPWTTDGMGHFAGLLVSPGGEFLGRMQVPGLETETFPGGPLDFGPTLRASGPREVALTLSTPARDWVLLWTAEGQSRVLATGPLKGFVLP